MFADIPIQKSENEKIPIDIQHLITKAMHFGYKSVFKRANLKTFHLQTSRQVYLSPHARQATF